MDEASIAIRKDIVRDARDLLPFVELSRENLDDARNEQEIVAKSPEAILKELTILDGLFKKYGLNIIEDEFVCARIEYFLVVIEFVIEVSSNDLAHSSVIRVTLALTMYICLEICARPL